MIKHSALALIFCVQLSQISFAAQEAQSSINIRFRNFTGHQVNFCIGNSSSSGKGTISFAFDPASVLNKENSEQALNVTLPAHSKDEAKKAAELKWHDILSIGKAISNTFQLIHAQKLNVFLHPAKDNTLVVVSGHTDPKYSYALFYDKTKKEFHMYRRNI